MPQHHGHCPGCGVATKYDTDPTCIGCQYPADITITKDDCPELFFMLKGRGGSGLKTKLLRALAAVDPRLHQDLLKQEG